MYARFGQPTIYGNPHDQSSAQPPSIVHSKMRRVVPEPRQPTLMVCSKLGRSGKLCRRCFTKIAMPIIRTTSLKILHPPRAPEDPHHSSRQNCPDLIAKLSADESRRCSTGVSITNQPVPATNQFFKRTCIFVPPVPACVSPGSHSLGCYSALATS